ncbi:MAG: ATP-grasp domain-containing protein [Selenomonadaceae bacterium]|nr:ATP-grasp domain-containing protein [Selenomonadaceae bacterium]
MKKKILLVECMSTGVNYIDDIIKRGFEPVILEGHQIGPKEEVKLIAKERDEVRARLSKQIPVIDENPNYDEVLRQVKKFNPVHVIAGSEFGVPLSVRLAHDLGLPGNPIESLDAMTQKDAMHEALKRAGIRHIRGKVVRSVEEAEKCYDEFGEKGVVVKLTRGAGTQGLSLCDTKEEMTAAVKKALATPMQAVGEKCEILLQERIHGKEYIVNTVSCAGEHRLVSMWVYDKIPLPNGTNAYNYAENITKLGIGHSRLIRYAFDTINAIGIKYGPVHGEYMVDENGPVLIEVNCRPMGAALPRKFADLIWGQHETDSALDAYIDPERFMMQKRKPYRALRKGAIKIFIVPEEVKVDSAPVLQISRQLKSFYSAAFGAIGRENNVLPATNNVETSGGFLYLLHEDEQAVHEDLDLLHRLEMNFSQALFNDSGKLPVISQKDADIAEIMKRTNLSGSVLIFSDTLQTEVPGAVLTNAEKLKTAYDGFDYGILDLRKTASFVDMESAIWQIFAFFRKIRQGGQIIIPETTYCHLPYGMDGMEILAKTAGLIIEAPEANAEIMTISVPTSGK